MEVLYFIVLVSGYVLLQNLRGCGIGRCGFFFVILGSVLLVYTMCSTLISGAALDVVAVQTLFWAMIALSYYLLVFYKCTYVFKNDVVAFKKGGFIKGFRLFNAIDKGPATIYRNVVGTVGLNVTFPLKGGSIQSYVVFYYRTLESMFVFDQEYCEEKVQHRVRYCIEQYQQRVIKMSSDNTLEAARSLCSWINDEEMKECLSLSVQSVNP